MRLKPLIGVSANWADETSRVAQVYLDAIAAAGGVQTAANGVAGANGAAAIAAD